MKLQLQKINIIRMLKLNQAKKPIIIIAALAICIGINIIVIPFGLRLDLSKGQAYTLSNSSKKILNKLKKKTAIIFFVSSDIPTKLQPVQRDVVDLLNEYRNAGKGNVEIKIKDPKKDQNAQKEAGELGIREMQFSQLEQDKYAVNTAYFGLAVSYGDKKEALPQIGELENLEYLLTSLLYKLSQSSVIKIGVINDPTPADYSQNPISLLQQILTQQFVLEPVDIKEEIKQEYQSMLLFDANKKEFSKEDIEKINNYLSRGGTILFFIDGVWVDEGMTTSDAKNNLFELLKSYGIAVQKNLILSSAAEFVNFGDANGSFLAAYPFWIRTNKFQKNTSYFSNINQISFPWVSSLKLEKRNGYDIQPLIYSTSQSWQQSKNFVLSPQLIPQPSEKDLQQFILAAESKSKSKGKIMLISSSRFILDRFISRQADNVDFVLNVLNDFTSGGALSGIRQRTVSYYPIPELAENTKDLFKYGNILILPILFALYSAFRLIKRK